MIDDPSDVNLSSSLTSTLVKICSVRCELVVVRLHLLSIAKPCVVAVLLMYWLRSGRSYRKSLCRATPTEICIQNAVVYLAALVLYYMAEHLRLYILQ